MTEKNVNILVQYEGGGYDGCVWEWNFFYIDPQGNFENIFASGCGGIKTQEAADELIKNGSNSFSNKLYIYHLDNREELKEFAKETNPALVQGVVRWFNNYNTEVQPFAVCGECGGEIDDADEIHCEDWHGCGGIMSQPETLICSECYSIGSCGYCGEYYGEESEDMIYTAKQISEKWDLPKGVAERVADNYCPVCEYCLESLTKQELDRRIKATQQT